MREYCLLLAFLLTLVAAPAGAQRPSPSTAELEKILTAETAAGFSGAVLVARGDKIILEAAYGDSDGASLTSRSPFWISSSAKQFTSAALLLCQQRGLLRLDDPIVRLFPEAPQDKRAITVRQLLSHTSGLGQSYASESARDRDTAVAAMLAEPLVDVPGKAFHYANSNYGLAAAVVEVASRQPHHDFVRTNLFRRAGLRRTGFAGDAGAAMVAPTQTPLPERLIHPPWGGAGGYSTVHDLWRWYARLHGGKVLDRAQTEQLFAPVVRIGEGQAALGWFIGRAPDGTATTFTRGNDDFGANSLLYAYPDTGVVIVVLTHAGNAPDGTSWSRRVHAKLEAAMAGHGGAR